MADLGTLTTVDLFKLTGKRVAEWATSPAAPLAVAIDTTGTLSGIVTEGGTEVPFCVVRLYYRPTGQLIAQTHSDADGLFTFTGLQVGVANYYALALDPDGGTQYNAVIFDRLSPV